MKRSRALVLLFTLLLAAGAAACSQTDAGVTTKVKAKLAADDTVKAYQIDVDTQRKVVTLKGAVDSEAARTQAVRLARDTEGVSNVVDQLTVKPRDVAPASLPDAAPGASDPGITTAVKSKLLADPAVSGLKIDVDTSEGVVTLSGHVKSNAERETAVRIARETDGVKRVTDMLTVGK
jgi:hyperosmotically inducible periplasmic protein